MWAAEGRRLLSGCAGGAPAAAAEDPWAPARRRWELPPCPPAPREAAPPGRPGLPAAAQPPPAPPPGAAAAPLGGPPLSRTQD